MRTEARDLSILTGPRRVTAPGGFIIQPADTAAQLASYRALRHDGFVRTQELFTHTDRDDLDDDPRTVVLCAVADDGTVLGGVRLAPATGEDIGWWTGSRLVVLPTDQARGVGPALVRAACAYAENAGVLRFDAAVQVRYRSMFASLGWDHTGEVDVAGTAHAAMRWPINKIERLVAGTKAMLADVLAPLSGHASGLGPAGFRGDDGSPVPGTDMIAACDAIIPSMVERDPEWAGWCAVLVNLNDLSAMGATPVGLLDAVGAPTRSQLTRIIRGMAKAAQAWNVPVLGGHTQSGVPASLSVTALGRTGSPVRPEGGGWDTLYVSPPMWAADGAAVTQGNNGIRRPFVGRTNSSGWAPSSGEPRRPRPRTSVWRVWSAPRECSPRPAAQERYSTSLPYRGRQVSRWGNGSPRSPASR